ncbi:DUF1963 domain-containing protein [Plantactinospora endophytica]|uniref:DUF1963 domain-containing protein n=1 Tax=Plantactinospora endophytica TaxID=673535 RepID=A0ABQ4E090_9ACTN|nr:DUF1963 domain-containing protein [Plantactinospora endophytica]GIG87752.1 hypothetical protein Pen02_26880 [Plantactinospora endophytica]
MISEAVQKLGPFHAEAARRGIPAADVERWLDTVRPCASLGPEADGPVVGRWGGNPMLPADLPHPPFTFVAAIDCAALPRTATDLPLPPDGELLFFGDPDPAWEDRPAGTVVHVPAGTTVVERGRDLDPQYGDWTLPGANLRLSIDPSLPNRAESTAEHSRGEELGGAWWNTESEIVHNGMMQLGGYPWVWNHDPVREAARREAAGAGDAASEVPEDDDWVLLAAGDGSYSDEAGESDLINWVIRRADLAARRFDRVHVVMDGM